MSKALVAVVIAIGCQTAPVAPPAAAPPTAAVPTSAGPAWWCIECANPTTSICARDRAECQELQQNLVAHGMAADGRQNGDCVPRDRAFCFAQARSDDDDEGESPGSGSGSGMVQACAESDSACRVIATLSGDIAMSACAEQR